MSFGETIKTLRRNSNMTQEKLAEILSISPQAISRWETNMAMPDISLIAPLCNLFNVTSDELLEIDTANRKKMIEDIIHTSDKYAQRGYLEEARRNLEEGLKKYPGNCELEHKLMYVVYLQSNASDDKQYLEKTIELGEDILAKSIDNYQRYSTIQILCFAYKNVGRIDEAVKMAGSMPNMSVSQEMLLSRIYTGSKAYTAKQCEAFYLLQFLSNCLCSLQTKTDMGENVYTDEEEVILLEKCISLFDLFFENGDYGFFHTHLCDTHSKLAVYYVKIGDQGKALLHLNAAAEHAIKFIAPHSEKHSSLVFRGLTGGSWTTNTKANSAAGLLKSLNNGIFDCIRSTTDFRIIEKKLSQYAGEWETY